MFFFHSGESPRQHNHLNKFLQERSICMLLSPLSINQRKDEHGYDDIGHINITYIQITVTSHGTIKIVIVK